MRWAFLLLLSTLGIMLTAHGAAADIYRCVGADGAIAFSGTPCAANAERVPESSGSVTRIQGGNADSPAAPAPPLPAEDQAVVRLKDGGSVILVTKTMQSNRGMTWHQGNNLALPSGVRVPYREMQRLSIESLSPDELVLEITMRNGQQRIEKIGKPWLSISGETDVGRFSRSLDEVREVVFR